MDRFFVMHTGESVIHIKILSPYRALTDGRFFWGISRNHEYSALVIQTLVPVGARALTSDDQYEINAIYNALSLENSIRTFSCLSACLFIQEFGSIDNGDDNVFS